MARVTFADCLEGWVFCGCRILLLKVERGAALARGESERSKLGLMAEKLRDEMRKDVQRRNADGLNNPPLDPDAVVVQTNGHHRYAGKLLGDRFQVMESFVMGTYYVVDHARDDLLVRAGGPGGDTRRFVTVADAEAWIKGFAPELFQDKETGALDAVPSEMKENDMPKVAKVATPPIKAAPARKAAKPTVSVKAVNAANGKANGAAAKARATQTTGVGARTRELIAEGLDNAGVIAKLRVEFPAAANTASNVNWYRNKMKKDAGASAAPTPSSITTVTKRATAARK